MIYEHSYAQVGVWGDRECAALTDMLRGNKHIRVVKLDGAEELAHDKFAALALPTVVVEKFTAGISTLSRSKHTRRASLCI